MAIFAFCLLLARGNELSVTQKHHQTQARLSCIVTAHLQVVTEVLDSCGNNIDEAIKLLGALQLSKANGTTHRSDAQGGGAEASAAEPSRLDSAHQGIEYMPVERRSLLCTSWCLQIL